jgi:hypothetical protein
MYVESLEALFHITSFLLRLYLAALCICAARTDAMNALLYRASITGGTQT